MKKLSVLTFLFFWGAISVVAFAADFVYDDRGQRDPFQSLVTKDGRILPGAKTVTETGTIDLEGVIWDPNGNSVAIMNGKLLKEKDRIFDMQLLKIKKDSVILQKEGKVTVVNLKKGGGNGYGL